MIETKLSSEQVQTCDLQSSSSLKKLRGLLLSYFLLWIGLSVVLLSFHHQIIAFFIHTLKSSFPELILMNLEVTRPFSLVISVVLFLSTLFLSPFFLISLWAFIAPGLYPREKKILKFHVIFSLSCILILQLFSCFIVVPSALKFFLFFNAQYFDTTLSILSLMEFFYLMQKGFFFCSLMPPILSLLLHFQVVSFYTVEKFRPAFYVLSFVLAMLLTPPDVLSQVLMAIPLIALFELTLWLLKQPQISKIC